MPCIRVRIRILRSAFQLLCAQSVTLSLCLALFLLRSCCCGCCNCCSFARSHTRSLLLSLFHLAYLCVCLWADYGCFRKCVETSRYLSMCRCDFRLQQLLGPLSGSVVLLFRLLRPATKSFSTCTRFADAVIICAFASLTLVCVVAVAFVALCAWAIM